MKKEIKIYNHSNLPTADFEIFEELQEDFKIMDLDRLMLLKRAIIERGFKYSFKAWKDMDGKLWIIDAHRRKQALKMLQADGYYIAPIPYEIIHAETKKEAIEEIAFVNSQYSDINPDTELFKKYDIQLEELPISMKEFNISFGDGSGEPGETKEEKSEVPGIPKEAITKFGDIYTLNEHMIQCGDSEDSKMVKKLLSDKHPKIMVTDPPYGVKYDPSWRETALEAWKKPRSTGKVLNDNKVSWYEAYKLFPGEVAYIWHAGKYGHIVADDIIKCGFDIVSQIIWNKQHFVISRGDYHWKHEPCQPAGTMVQTPDGSIPIENLKDGDSVVSYDSYSSQIVGKRDGRKIKVSNRNYNGDLYEINVAQRKTKVTDGHQFSIRYTKDAEKIWCTYIMRKGKWWRVGIIRAFNSRGFGLTVRLRQEDGDEAWLINIHKDKNEASCHEQILSVKYGIPTTHWNTNRNLLNDNVRNSEQIRMIYDHLNLDDMKINAHRLITDFGRIINYPVITKEDCKHVIQSRHKTVLIRACNLIHQLMELPIPYPKGDEFNWCKIDYIERKKFSGIVYSLDVEKNHHYIADGIITHNCWYAVKEGHKHNWQGARDQSTVWEIKNNSAMGNAEKEEVYGHGTQKPFECMARPIRNNTESGEWVYDPFLGSGTTLIACQTLNRICIGQELLPNYVDVIVERWINFMRDNDLYFKIWKNGKELTKEEMDAYLVTRERIDLSTIIKKEEETSEVNAE